VSVEDIFNVAGRFESAACDFGEVLYDLDRRVMEDCI
jgi:hypothetical protein